MAKIRIEMEFTDFRDIFLGASEIQEPWAQRLTAIMRNKIDAAIRRESYTQYKTAATPEEREKARQQYLEAAGISKDFRW